VGLGTSSIFPEAPAKKNLQAAMSSAFWPCKILVHKSTEKMSLLASNKLLHTFWYSDSVK
jgi:hypothetical protein